MKNKRIYLSITFLCLFLSFFSINTTLSLNKSSKFLACTSVKKEIIQSNSGSSSQNCIYFEETNNDDIIYHNSGLIAIQYLNEINIIITSVYFNLFSHRYKSIPIIINSHSLRI